MRIGLVIYGSLDTVSGGYLYDRQLVEYLRRQGDEVTLVSLPWRNYARHLGDNLATQLVRHLAGLQVDILLQDELNAPSLFWINRRLRKHIHYPIITIVHHLRGSEAHPAWQKWLYRWVEKRYLTTLDGFIFNSQATRQSVDGLLDKRVRTNLYVVAYPAGDRFQPQISEQALANRALAPGPLRLLFVGNLIPRKGLHTLLAALRQVPELLWRLDIVGSPEVNPGYAREMRQMAEEAPLIGKVQFCGMLPDNELATALEAHHVLVVPSSYEGFGIVYLEGMGFGLPAIGTDEGGAREIITPGEDGFLVPADDIPALTRRIAELAPNRQRLLRMSLAARQRYLTHPTWTQTAHQIRDFLRSLTV